MRLINSFFWMYMSPNAIWPFMKKTSYSNTLLPYVLGSSRHEKCIIPMMMSLNLLNSFPWSGFVKKSPIIFAVGKCIMLSSPFWTLFFMKKYLMLMCLDFCPADFLPFFSICWVLMLSWYKSLSLILYPWASMKYAVQIACGHISLAPTKSASVELFVFNFCFNDLA